MSTEIGGRPVLRPAGNVALSKDNKTSYPRKPTKKPPPSPPLKPTSPVSVKISPPNSLPSTPRIPKSPVSKPSPSPKLLSPKKLSSPSHKPCPHLNVAPLRPPQLHDCMPLDPLHTHDDTFVHLTSSADATDVSPASEHTNANACVEASSEPEVLTPRIPAVELLYDLDSADDELLPCLNACIEASTACSTELLHPRNKHVSSSESKSSALPQKPKPRAILTRSSSEVIHRGAGPNAKARGGSGSKNFNSFGGHSLDEASLAHFAAAKKAAANELLSQRKLKVAEYGRKVGKAARVAPDVPSVSPALDEPQRCKFITAQSDPLYVEYHDKEWGVPVHDDRCLFELLVLAGAQVELSWTTILHRRDTYRDAFCGYDAASVALFHEKHIQSLEADKTLMLPGGKVRGVVENAKKILEVVKEFGSLDNYLWGFLNNKPMINNHRYPKQVPVKTSKSEFISKDLVKRGFRFVGPTIIYSFMQAAGMTNDHLIQCFRHQECGLHLSISQLEKLESDASLDGDEDQLEAKVPLCEFNKQTYNQEQPETVHI